jgi:hypothetical protein
LSLVQATTLDLSNDELVGRWQFPISHHRMPLPPTWSPSNTFGKAPNDLQIWHAGMLLPWQSIAGLPTPISVIRRSGGWIFTALVGEMPRAYT